MNNAKEVFSKIKRDLDFITMISLNRTVADLAIFKMPNLVQEVFDRPTPFIMKGFEYKKATRENLTAALQIKDWVGPSPQKSLSAEIFGGARKPKRFELALRAKGILPPDQFVAPGRDAKLDSYGNIASSQIIQILSGLGAFTESGYIANKSNRKGARINKNTNNLFVINRLGRKSADFLNDHYNTINVVKGLPMGIYMRVGKYGIKQLMKFIKQPVYSKRFNFYNESQKLGFQIFNYEFNKAFKQYANT